MVEIRDEESARAWLQEQPREVWIAFAARTSLRALPLIGHEPDGRLNRITLPFLRANILTSVAAVGPVDTEIKRAASEATIAIGHTNSAESPPRTGWFASAAAVTEYSTSVSYDTSDNALVGASRPCVEMFAEPTFRTEVQEATNQDAGKLESGEISDIFTLPLWPIDASANSDGLAFPAPFVEGWKKLWTFWDRDRATWDFWARWYARMLRGDPMPWDLQRRIALIPEGEWGKGPERIAELLRGIEAEFKAGVPEAIQPGDWSIQEVPDEEQRIPLNAETLSFQANRLIETRRTTVQLCNVTADAIDAATNANSLPEEFDALREISPRLRLIAELAESKERILELEAQVAVLIQTVAKLTSALEGAKGKSRKDLFLDTATTTTAVCLTTGFWGLVVGTASYVTGIVDVGDLFDRIAQRVDGLPLEAPEINRPEPPSDGPKFVRPER